MFRARLILTVAATLLAGACSPAGVIVGGAATAGVVVAQERSVGQAIDDLAIRAEISSYLFEADEKLFIAVGIEVVEARVLLTGHVPTPEDRIQAVRLAWKASGVREVLNEIQVTDKGGLGNYLRDVAIANQLRAELLFDRDIAAINYNVEVVNQVVYLIGIARDQAELDKAIGHARTIPYVEKVVSHVVLKGDAPRA
ncbi:MAG: BON domain-containing protein [Alphaproteobacteria bacterium]